MTADPLGDDLAEHMASDLRVHDSDTHTFGPPLNADQANAMLRKLWSLQRQRDEIVDRYDAELRRLTSWHDDRTHGIDLQLHEVERNLEGWMRGQHDVRGVVTEHLPSGELWLRGARRSIVVEDDTKLGVWLRQHPAVNVTVRTTYKVDKASLQDAVYAAAKVDGDAGPAHEFHAARLDDGTIVPGVLIREPTGKTFSIHESKGTTDG